MKIHWRYWLIPLLTIGLFISIFEVNTGGIVNTWGDAWDTYLPAEFMPDPVHSVSGVHDCLAGASIRLVRQIAFHTPAVLSPALSKIPADWVRCQELFLRWCQWRI
ncbi:hypothetical protein [Nibrella viscosa]|uniref:hypothetical protein n=1 Tax=Nibrella viscosa TaxID=1084524 RepID=UPI0031EFC459